MKRFYVPFIMLILIGAAFMACDENATDPVAGEQTGTVTFNITAPYFEETSGKPIEVSVWSSWDDDLPLLTQSGTVSGATLSLSIADVDTGTYLVTVAIDVDNNGFGTGPADEGDLLWAALDIIVLGDETITVSQYGWHYIEGHLIAFGIRGIPAGNSGEIIALGIFEDGADIYLDSVETIYGGVGLVYGETAVIFAMEDVEDSNAVAIELPTGNYDVYMVVDLDGTLDDWFGIDSHGPAGNPITNGDLLASYNLTYDAAGDHNFIISPTFEEVQAYILTFNITAPDANFNGLSVMAVLMHNFDQNDPTAVDTSTISSGTATISLSVLAAGTYSFAVIIDGTENGFGDLEDPPVDAGDFVWGATGISITGDKTVNIGGDSWQYYHSMIIALDNVPAGHDGEIFAVAMLPDGSNPLDPYIDEHAEMFGLGLVYENSAFIALTPADGYDNPDWVLQEGNYDIWCLVDVDGTLADYDYPEGDSSASNPSTVGDWYVLYDYAYDTSYQSHDDFIFAEGTFDQIVGITGTVSCPPWNGDGGDIYVYLFRESPLISDSSDTYSYDVISQPGTYSLPCFPGDSVVVIGFWDMDNSGEWDGPTHAVDYFGGYGTAVDSLTYVTCLAAGVSNINFTITTMYDSTQYGP